MAKPVPEVLFPETLFNVNSIQPNPTKLFRKLCYIDNISFSFISHGFFSRPSVH